MKKHAKLIFLTTAILAVSTFSCPTIVLADNFNFSVTKLPVNFKGHHLPAIASEMMKNKNLVVQKGEYETDAELDKRIKEYRNLKWVVLSSKDPYVAKCGVSYNANASQFWIPSDCVSSLEENNMGKVTGSYIAETAYGQKFKVIKADVTNIMTDAFKSEIHVNNISFPRERMKVLAPSGFNVVIFFHPYNYKIKHFVTTEVRTTDPYDRNITRIVIEINIVDVWIVSAQDGSVFYKHSEYLREAEDTANRTQNSQLNDSKRSQASNGELQNSKDEQQQQDQPATKSEDGGIGKPIIKAFSMH